VYKNSIKPLNSIGQAYADWLSPIDWKYLITLHFNKSLFVDNAKAVKLVRQWATRLHGSLNRQSGTTTLSLFPVLEVSASGIPHVHVLVGPENTKCKTTTEIFDMAAYAWGRLGGCSNPKSMSNNRGWFKLVDEHKSQVIEYTTKEYRWHKDPVLVEAISINFTK
jgi:hypothetical protein